MKRIIFQAAALLFSVQLFLSCEEGFVLPGEFGNGDLSSNEIVEGLKTALITGADSSTNKLSKLDGYYDDLTTRIPLPDEVYSALDKLDKLGLKDVLTPKITELAKAINNSAGEAAKDAMPIFKDAITDLSITDGLSILQGKSLLKSSDYDSTAATEYLKSQTKASLTELYAPKMNAALGKPFASNLSTKELWESITGTYNDAVKIKNALPFGEKYDEINTDLGAFVTEKALDGLFLKVGEEEKQIRKNPLQYASDIIQKVFGAIF